MEYRLKRHQESFKGVTIELETIADLNETIDRLFEELERTGDGKLLEELCPYFGTVWPSARALSEWVVEKAESLKGKRVLEAGCGLALPSLVAAKIGARVLATDFHPDVPKFLARNLAHNSLELEYRAIDWRASKVEMGELFDFVIGSDVLYERQHAIELAQTVSKLVAPLGEVWIADPARPYLQGFADEMERLGFSHQTEIRAVPDSHGPKEIFLLRFRK